MKITRKNFVLTPGDLARIEVCPGAGVYDGPKFPPTSSMWWGIFVHRFLEYAQTRGREEALEYIKRKCPRAYKTGAAINVRSIPLGHVEPEFVLDPVQRTARQARYSEARHDRNVYARADLVFVDTVGLHVADWKSGDSQTSPWGTAQLLTLACAASEVYPTTGDVRGSVVKVRGNGDLEWVTAVYTDDELEQHFERMHRGHLQVQQVRAQADAGAQVDFVRGPQCSRCSVLPVCPAWLDQASPHKARP